MNKLAQSADTADADSDQEGDPEQLLDEWLGELDNLTGVSFREFRNFGVRVVSEFSGVRRNFQRCGRMLWFIDAQILSHLSLYVTKSLHTVVGIYPKMFVENV